MGVIVPEPCVKIVVLDPPPPTSMTCVVYNGGGTIGFPVGEAERVDHPALGVIYKVQPGGTIWVFDGGPTSGTWHEINPSGADRSGTWGPC